MPELPGSEKQFRSPHINPRDPFDGKPVPHEQPASEFGRKQETASFDKAAAI